METELGRIRKEALVHGEEGLNGKEDETCKYTTGVEEDVTKKAVGSRMRHRGKKSLRQSYSLILNGIEGHGFLQHAQRLRGSGQCSQEGHGHCNPSRFGGTMQAR